MVITSLAGSGAERITLNLAEMFIAHGHTVDLFLLENRVNFPISPAINLHPLTRSRQYYKWLGVLGDRLLANKLLRQIDRLKLAGPIQYDLFLSHLPAADKVVSLCQMANTWYCIHTSYSGEIAQFIRQKRTLRASRKRRLYRSLYSGRNLVAVSCGVKKDLEQDMQIRPLTIETIYNPFDFDNLRTLANSKSAAVPDFDFIVHAGAFRPVKRHDLLLDAFARIKHAIKLVLLTEPCSELNRMIQNHGLQDRVFILGHQVNPYPVMKAAKLMVLCSDREGLPTVIIESLILGTPVISTDCPSGPREILTGALTRWLVTVNDPVALAEKIDMALDSKIPITESDIEKFDRKEAYLKYRRLITTR